MEKLGLVTLDSKIGQKSLRRKALTVVKFDKELKNIVRQMKEMMVAQNGVGLAANQIGLDLAIFIARPKDIFYVFINPATETAGEAQLKEEGCLSLPGKWGMVKRYNKIKIQYQDIMGKQKKMVAKNMLAHIIQHETDHLQGVLFIDKATDIYEINSNPKSQNSK